jgi:hypothetical protein
MLAIPGKKKDARDGTSGDAELSPLRGASWSYPASRIYWSEKRGSTYLTGAFDPKINLYPFSQYPFSQCGHLTQTLGKNRDHLYV